MRLIRIYQAGPYITGQHLTLSPQQAQHVGLVLRMRVGDSLILFSGDNREFEAKIEAVDKKQVLVLVGEEHYQNRESPLNIHLAQGLSKGDRMEFVIQKAVELGVQRITPLITQHCAIKLNQDKITKKQQQWQAIIISACEQCGRNQLPILDEPLRFNTYLTLVSAESKWILHPRGGKSLNEYPKSSEQVALLIGPEGGFSEEEFQSASHANFLPLSLGPRILRTETAAIAALSMLQAMAGDL